MPGTMLGMNTDQARQTAKTFQTEAGNIKASIAKVDGALKGTQWVGNDQKKFVSDWEGHKRQLEAARVTLEQASQELNRQAQEQDATSGK